MTISSTLSTTPSFSPSALWRRGAFTSSEPRRRGATRPTGDGSAYYVTAAATSSTTDLGLPAAQEARPTTRSSSGTMKATDTALGSPMPAPTTGRARRAPLPKKPSQQAQLPRTGTLKIGPGFQSEGFAELKKTAVATGQNTGYLRCQPQRAAKQA